VIFPSVAALLLLLPTLLLAAIVGLVRWLLRRPQRRYWAAIFWTHLVLLLLHLFVTFPALLGWFGARGLGTRGDERAYAGPRLDADGRWLLQDRSTLAAERRGEVVVDPGLATAAAARAVQLQVADGLTLRAFRVAAAHEPPRAVAVLVHGLFRCAIELESPAAMLRRAGCEVWLLEQRNHGGSSRAPASFGLRESRDLVAAVAQVRTQRPGVPLLLFGVSLGSVAVALALPGLDDVAGVVLDAPVDDVLGTAQRMLALERAGDRRRLFALWEPWRSMVLAAIELWGGFRFVDVRPAAALTGLPASLPVLLIGGADDDKVPSANVQALYDSLPMPPRVKELWIVAGAGHGDGWLVAPREYEQRLRAFVQRATGR
jgi:alpha-beta hydrolase superfamily lysophospholipase